MAWGGGRRKQPAEQPLESRVAAPARKDKALGLHSNYGTARAASSVG